MYLKFKEYLEGAQIAQILLKENMFEYVLFSDYILIRKIGFLSLSFSFIADTVKIEFEFYGDKDLCPIKDLKALIVEVDKMKHSEYSGATFVYPNIHQFIVRFTDYDQFIKFFNKYILDSNV